MTNKKSNKDISVEDMLKPLLSQIESIKEGIATKRDKLRILISEMEELNEILTNADDCIGIGIEEINIGIETMSELV